MLKDELEHPEIPDFPLLVSSSLDSRLERYEGVRDLADIVI